ncbi:MAG: hotdog fold domain-containing protein [Gemmatimonadota bacterium]
MPSPSSTSADLSAPGARLLASWRRLSGLPGGKRLFSLLVGWMTPYSGTIGARVAELEPGWCRVTLRDRRRVRNHLASVHAMALANLAEMASGLAVLVGLPPGVQGIVTGFSISYHKKARGLLTAECRASGLEVTSEQEYEAAVAITDAAGVVVARATAKWRLRPIPTR